MNARLMILLVAAAGMAVYLVLGKAGASKQSNTAGSVQADGPMIFEKSAEETESIRRRQTPLDQRSLPGEEPSETPQFTVTVDVNLASGKNQLCFNITETHGYYAETLLLEYWHTGEDGTVPRENTRLSGEEPLNNFVEANKTLRICMELVPAELANIDGRIGESRNWAGRVISCKRARVKNPDPLPEL